MVVPESMERRREQQRTMFIFLFLFFPGMKANDLSYLTATETTKVSQTYIFTFFFLCSVLEGGREELLLYETSVLFETTFKMLA